jgi:hypothetical protein
MKQSISILSVVILAFAAIGCAGTPSKTQTPLQIATAAEPYVRSTVALGTSGGLLFVSNTSQRLELASELYASGQNVYALTTGTIPTPAQLLIAINNGAPINSVQLQGITNLITPLYMGLYPALVSGSNTALTIKVIGDIGAGLEDGASTYIPKQTAN